MKQLFVVTATLLLFYCSACILHTPPPPPSPTAFPPVPNPSYPFPSGGATLFNSIYILDYRYLVRNVLNTPGLTYLRLYNAINTNNPVKKAIVLIPMDKTNQPIGNWSLLNGPCPDLCDVSNVTELSTNPNIQGAHPINTTDLKNYINSFFSYCGGTCVNAIHIDPKIFNYYITTTSYVQLIWIYNNRSTNQLSLQIVPLDSNGKYNGQQVQLINPDSIRCEELNS